MAFLGSYFLCIRFVSPSPSVPLPSKFPANPTIGPVVVVVAASLLIDEPTNDATETNPNPFWLSP